MISLIVAGFIAVQPSGQQCVQNTVCLAPVGYSEGTFLQPINPRVVKRQNSLSLMPEAGAK